MKRLLFTCLVLPILVLAAATACAAQDEAPALFGVLTVHVKPGQQQDFDADLMNLWTAFKKAGLDRQIDVGNELGGPYTFVVGYSSWSDFGAVNETVNSAYESAPDVLLALQKAQTHSDLEVWAARPDLSYVPDSPRVADSDQTYSRIVLLYPHPEHSLDLEGAMKEVNAVRKEEGIRDGRAVFELAVGAGQPAFAILIGAKDEVDSLVQGAENRDKMGDAWQTYLRKTGPMLRDIEFRSSNARPDLAYPPP